MRILNFHLFLFTILFTTQAIAKCPPGYEQQERAAIKTHYQNQISQVNIRRDEKIRAALESYKKEYYPEAKALLNEFQAERAALSERIREDGPGEGKQRQYNDEAREIGREYHQEINVLKKDHSGKYWQEINAARQEAKEMRQEFYALKDEEIADLRVHIAQKCKDKRTPLRKAFEWTSDQIEKGKKPKKGENPSISHGGPGIRG